MVARSVDSAIDRPAVPRRLGDYRLTSLIGAGPTCAVYRAHLSERQDGEIYAVKCLQPAYVNDAELGTTLVRAARAAARVSAPTFMEILEVREHPEPHVVMRHVDGVSLKVLSHATSAEERIRCVLPVLVDVLDGLEALHARAPGGSGALVHGAPVARHIVVGRDGVGRLIDCLHVVGEDAPWSPRQCAGLLRHEMAPEQTFSPAHVDGRCDIYVVGLVLWELLTGKALSSADDAAEESRRSVRRIWRDPIEAPSEAQAQVPQGLAHVCLRALQRARVDRYRTAAEMAAALREAAEQAGLFASRKEIGAWVERVAAVAKLRADCVLPERADEGGAARVARAIDMRSVEPCTATAAPGTGTDRAAAGAQSVAFRPSRPARARHSAPRTEDGGRSLGVRDDAGGVAGGADSRDPAQMPSSAMHSAEHAGARDQRCFDVSVLEVGDCWQQKGAVAPAPAEPAVRRLSKSTMGMGLLLGMVLPLGLLALAREEDVAMSGELHGLSSQPASNSPVRETTREQTLPPAPPEWQRGLEQTERGAVSAAGKAGTSRREAVDGAKTTSLPSHARQGGSWPLQAGSITRRPTALPAMQSRAQPRSAKDALPRNPY